MADDDNDDDNSVAPPKGGPDSPKKRAGREKLIVGGTLILIVLTYLIYRRTQANAASSNATTSTATPSSNYDPTGGAFAGPGMYGQGDTGTPLVGISPDDPTIQAIEADLAGLQTQLAAIPATQNQVAAASPVATPSAPGTNANSTQPPAPAGGSVLTSPTGTVMVDLTGTPSSTQIAASEAANAGYGPGGPHAGPGVYGAADTGTPIVGVAPDDSTIQAVVSDVAGTQTQLAAIPADQTQVAPSSPAAVAAAFTAAPGGGTQATINGQTYVDPSGAPNAAQAAAIAGNPNSPMSFASPSRH
jgi:hypothetical protein